MADYEFVRIPVTNELIKFMFLNGEKHYEVCDGIDKSYKFRGLIQDSNNAMFYFIFSKGRVPEGACMIDKTPLYKRK